MNNRMKQSLKKHKWVIGVSGGSDSMALLHMCHMEQIDIVVAHMNYRKRQTADRDMQVVIQYCERYHIPYQIRFPETTCQSNFQAYARDVRYAFYKDVVKQYQAYGVLVAHQLEDHLETYLMQKKRQMQPTYFGIQEETYIKGCFIKRILLGYRKEELQSYCRESHVLYYDDESNFSDIYERNRIRHEIIEKMTICEKEEMCKKIEMENKELCKQRNEMMKYYQLWDASKKKLFDIPEKYHIGMIDEMIYRQLQHHVTRKEVLEIYRQFLGNKNWIRKLSHGYAISSAYGKLIVHEEAQAYTYILDTVCALKTPYFEIAVEGNKKEGFSVMEEEFPLTIRNVRHDDKIRLTFGTKAIHRWFIDKKIPAYQRAMWPVVVNRYEEIIFSPQIGCDIAHFSNNPLLFMIK
ncbi:MAG: tRNA lysidine(34) synthetase TilS [Erysipelotrichaceae bacterium]|nr:tRNA lysidine(34) synthetase TilS [Erysipelotrichaceae bacterium]